MKLKNSAVFILVFLIISTQFNVQAGNKQELKLYQSLNKQLSQIEEKIECEKGKLNNNIQKKFALTKENVLVLVQNTDKINVPIALLSNEKKPKNIELVQDHIQKLHNLLEPILDDNEEKNIVFERYHATSTWNNLSKNQPLTLLETLIFEKAKKRILQTQTLLKNLIKHTEREEFTLIKTNSAHNVMLDLIRNATIRTNSTSAQNQKSISITIAPTKEAKDLFALILKRVVNSINYNKPITSSFNVFNSHESQDPDNNATYQSLLTELFDIFQKIQKTCPYKQIGSDPVHKELIKMVALCQTGIQSFSSQSNYIEEIAKMFATKKQSKEWISTASTLIKEKEKRLQEFVFFKHLQNFAQKYLAFSQNKAAMKVSNERYSNKYLVPLCTKYMSKTKLITNAPVQRCQLGLLFLINVCMKIDEHFANDFEKIKQLIAQKNILLHKLNSCKTFTKNTAEEEIPEPSNEQQNEMSKEKNEFNKINAQPTILINYLTKKLKKERQLAQYLLNPQGSNFNNQLSDAEAAIFHNLPLLLLEHPEITEIRTRILKGEKYKKPDNCILRKIGNTLFFWVPAIINYQVNGTEKTEKGAIELYLNTDESKVFHLWFKNLATLENNPNIPQPVVTKITTKLDALDPTKAQATLSSQKIQDLIPTKNGWALELVSTEQKFLLINQNTATTKINWIFYA